MFCSKCGATLPDDAVFCLKCGNRMSGGSAPATASAPAPQVLASADATSINCPSCGAPVAPQFGEMIVTCQYCGSSVTLSSGGWTNVQKQTMLPLTITNNNDVTARLHSLMDRGFLHGHVQEESTLQEMTLSYVPYWLVGVSARTSVIAQNLAAEGAQIATTAALAGILGGGLGGGRRGGGGLLAGAALGAMMGGNMGGGGIKKAEEMNENYNYPVIALKALGEYQPHDYQFGLQDRVLFDVGKIPKGVKILNGDISEDAAKYQAKTLVDQLQSQKAHAKYHMIQQLNTQSDVTEAELLHAPIWFTRYDHKGNKIVVVLDAHSGNVINSIGL